MMAIEMPKVVPEYKEVAKNKIIQAATSAFSKKGYYDSSMDDIAKEVGVTKATLYLYFKSKKDLLKAISLLENQALREMLQKSFDSHHYMDSLRGIIRMKMDLLKGFLRTGFEMIGLSSHDEDIRKIIRDERRKDIEALQEHIQDQMNKGTIRNDVEPSVLAHLILALYWEMATQLLAGFEKSKVYETWSKSLAIILEK
jgi:AcrR family transcriptional regulator